MIMVAVLAAAAQAATPANLKNSGERSEEIIVTGERVKGALKEWFQRRQ